MPKLKELSSKLQSEKLMSLFYIISFLYFPLFILFVGGAIYSKIFLSIITALNFILAFLVLGSFSYYLAEFLDSKSDKFGELMLKYSHRVVMPIIMLKVLGYAVFRMLPKVHNGILCDMVDFIKDLFFILRYQETLNLLLATTFVGLGLIIVVRLIRR